MAKVREMDQAAFEEWVADRPPVVQEMCKKLPPDRLYRMTSTGRRVTLYSYSGDGTVTVEVSPKYNALVFGRRVFGVAADDLAECDLPGPDEPVGALLTEDDDIDDFCRSVRDYA